MATRTPSAAVRKRILAAIREVEKTGTVTNQVVLQYLRNIDQGASMSDVQTVVKEYREEAEAHAATMSAVPPMPEEVLELFEKSWSLIWKKAEEPVASIKAHYATELEKKRLREEELESDMLAVEGELETANGRADAAEARALHAEKELVAAKMEIARLEGRLSERLTFGHSSVREINEETQPDAEEDAARANGRLMEHETDIVSRTKQPELRRPRTQLGPEKPESAAEKHDDPQPDMFPHEGTNERKPDDPEEIAAE